MGHTVRVIAPYSGSKTSLDPNNIVASEKTIPMPLGGSVARITLSPKLPWRIKAILEEEKFDIIHLHEPLVPLLPLGTLYFSKSVNVGTFHACHNTPRGYHWSRHFLKRWHSKLDGKIAVSRPAMDFVSRYFPGQYNIIPNGIDFEHFSAPVPPIEEFCDGKLNLLFVGRLEKRKGLDYLLDAYEKLRREFSNLRLIVVGPRTRFYHNYEKIVRKRRLEDVVFAGRVSYSDLARYYRTADIFCAPATGEESFGIILLEAMAAGRPIVASNIEGYASVLTHGTEGLLVPPRDREALVQAIGFLLGDAGARREMGARGRVAAEEYDWQHIARRVIDYYLGLLEDSSMCYKGAVPITRGALKSR
jgi:phosphatidylinositol alpha-mannosyltransferase